MSSRSSNNARIETLGVNSSRMDAQSAESSIHRGMATWSPSSSLMITLGSARCRRTRTTSTSWSKNG